MAWSKDSIVHLLEVDSTNRYVRDEAAALWQNRGISDFAVVTAGHQTAGRGQRGNTWNSNAGENLLFSILVRPGETLEVSKQFLLSQAVALSIHDAMKCHGIETQLNWQTDIYAGNRKLAGIRLELDYSGTFVEQAIIGIGLNVNQEGFPPMDRVPVSMKMVLKKEFAVESVLHNVLDKFKERYTQLCNGKSDAIATEYSHLLLGIGEMRTFIDKDGHFEAVIQGVESDGHLILQRTDGGMGRYAFKEVEMVIF